MERKYYDSLSDVDKIYVDALFQKNFKGTEYKSLSDEKIEELIEFTAKCYIEGRKRM